MSYNLNRPLADKIDSQIGASAEQTVEAALKGVKETIQQLFLEKLAPIIAGNTHAEGSVYEYSRIVVEKVHTVGVTALRHNMQAAVLQRLIDFELVESQG